MRLLSLAAAALIGSSIACRAGHPAPVSPTTFVSIGPRDPRLTPPRFGAETHRLRVSIQAANAAAERPMSETVRTQGPVAEHAAEVLLTSAWAPPYTTVDSAIIDPRGLVPVSELLRYNGFTRQYHYAGNRVWGTVQHADSTPRPFDRTFPEPVFAFNEVEVLVRSLPWQRGFSAVAPLFSEVDEAVEHDTMTVVGPDSTPRSEPAWIVRFADPAIVTTYAIGAKSRAILSTETLQRRTGAVLRYRELTRPE